MVDNSAFCERAHAAGALVTVATDLMALTLLTTAWRVGRRHRGRQRAALRRPDGYGGPHAAFFATRDEFKRLLPGRIIGVSRDSHGQPALRMALQTREQHIRREKATSNVCTAQVLLSVMASMYGVYHGPAGVTRIARRIQRLTATFVAGLETLGLQVLHDNYFDTVRVEVGVHWHAGGVLLALAAATPAAFAQAWPGKPLKVIVNFPPGGAADQLARAVSQPLSEALGQPVVVENRGGSGGNLGGDAVAKSPADGYTLADELRRHGVGQPAHLPEDAVRSGEGPDAGGRCRARAGVPGGQARVPRRPT